MRKTQHQYAVAGPTKEGQLAAAIFALMVCWQERYRLMHRRAQRADHVAARLEYTAKVGMMRAVRYSRDRALESAEYWQRRANDNEAITADLLTVIRELKAELAGAKWTMTQMRPINPPRQLSEEEIFALGIDMDQVRRDLIGHFCACPTCTRSGKGCKASVEAEGDVCVSCRGGMHDSARGQRAGEKGG